MLVEVINGEYKGQSFQLIGTLGNSCILSIDGEYKTFNNKDLYGNPLTSKETEEIEYLLKRYKEEYKKESKSDFVEGLEEEIGVEKVKLWLDDFHFEN